MPDLTEPILISAVLLRTHSGTEFEASAEGINKAQKYLLEKLEEYKGE